MKSERTKWQQKVLDTHKGLEKKFNNNSTSAAVRLFCLECVGNSASDVKNCSDTCCFLHPYRFGTRPNKRTKKTEDLDLSEIFPELSEAAE